MGDVTACAEMREESEMRGIVRASLIALLSGIWLASPGWAAQSEPTTIVKQVTEQVFGILENPQLQGPEKRQERQQRMKQISAEIFDWEEMARRALARHWRGLTPQQQQEFVGLFRDLVERSYMNRLDSAVGEKQNILYTGEQADGSRVLVKTRVVTKRNQEVPIDYSMHKGDGRWQVYDVIIEGISLISNYRSQFNRILTSSSYDDLVQKIKSRQAEEAFAGPERKPR